MFAAEALEAAALEPDVSDDEAAALISDASEAEASADDACALWDVSEDDAAVALSLAELADSVEAATADDGDSADALAEEVDVHPVNMPTLNAAQIIIESTSFFIWFLLPGSFLP